MTSIERVTAAIERKPVDRVPFGHYLIDCDIVGFGTKYENFMAMLDEFEKLR